MSPNPDRNPLPLGMGRFTPCSGKWNWHWFQQWPQGNKARKADRIESGRQMIAAFVEEVKELV